MTAPAITRLLSRITPAEQHAVVVYRGRLARLHDRRRTGANRRYVKDKWWRALHDLRAAASGSPSYDRYIARQQARYATWLEASK